MGCSTLFSNHFHILLKQTVLLFSNNGCLVTTVAAGHRLNKTQCPKSPLMIIPCRILCLSQSSAGCHLRRAPSWGPAVVLPMEKLQSPSQALWPQQCESEQPEELSSPLSQENHSELCSHGCSWHTNGSSRHFTN